MQMILQCMCMNMILGNNSESWFSLSGSSLAHSFLANENSLTVFGNSSVPNGFLIGFFLVSGL